MEIELFVATPADGVGARDLFDVRISGGDFFVPEKGRTAQVRRMRGSEW
jgi:hypothetical protein